MFVFDQKFSFFLYVKIFKSLIRHFWILSKISFRIRVLVKKPKTIQFLTFYNSKSIVFLTITQKRIKICQNSKKGRSGVIMSLLAEKNI